MAPSSPRAKSRGSKNIAVVALAALLAVQSPAVADSPPPSPVPSTAPQAVPPIPKDFDPCGGPLELLNKIGNGTACVFVLGEAALTAQYSSANIPANEQISALGHTLNVSGYAHAFGYPAPVVYVGVMP